MKLTEQNIRDLASKNGEINGLQLRFLGVSTPPKRGWFKSLIGTHIEPDAYSFAELLANRDGQKERDSELEDFKSYKLPPAPEKPRQSPARAVCVAMQVPVELVETVQGLIRLRDSLVKAVAFHPISGV